MKKLIYYIMLSVLFVAVAENASAKPIYITVHIGFFAKWDITTGSCESGWGICVSIPPAESGYNGQFGYDDANSNSFYIRIPKSSAESKFLSSGKLEIKEDSPLDPQTITSLSNFKNPGQKTVVIKKGAYIVKQEGDFYVTTLNYYLK